MAAPPALAQFPSLQRALLAAVVAAVQAGAGPAERMVRTRLEALSCDL